MFSSPSNLVGLLGKKGYRTAHEHIKSGIKRTWEAREFEGMDGIRYVLEERKEEEGGREGKRERERDPMKT